MLSMLEKKKNNNLQREQLTYQKVRTLLHI